MGHLGRGEDARTELDECDRIDPAYAKKRVSDAFFSNAADNEHFIDGLRKAGWEG